MDFEPEDKDWEAIKDLITDWGISHTTLEEVFMKVIRLKEDEDEDLEEEEALLEEKMDAEAGWRKEK